MILGLHVDDGLIMGKNQKEIENVLKSLAENVELRVMDLGNFVGMEIVRETDASIFIHQSNYISKLIKKFNLNDAKKTITPADHHTILSEQETKDTAEEEVPYREAIGSLIYAAIVTRPDIAFAVGLATRFMKKHGRIDWNAVKRTMKYLNATKVYGIRYTSHTEEKQMGYLDSDYAGDLQTRKPTSGYLFVFSNGRVSWTSQRQQIVTLSRTEALDEWRWDETGRTYCFDVGRPKHNTHHKECKPPQAHEVCRCALSFHSTIT